MKNEIMITYDTFKTIIRDSKNFTVETGGILVGTLGDTITIVGAGSSGENSVHHSTQYTSDVVSDKNCFKAASQKYGKRITIIGWWHKHPSGFDRPSGGDIMQVRQLSKDYADNKPVLMGIVNQHMRLLRKSTSLKLYSVSEDNSLVEYNWKLVRSDDKKLLENINKSSTVPEIKTSTFWANPDFRFHLNPIGRERIIQERDSLVNAGFQVINGQRKNDKTFTMDISDSNVSLRLVFPPEFPLNPPVVYLNQPQRITGLNSLNQWNSSCTLLAMVEEAKNILKC